MAAFQVDEPITLLNGSHLNKLHNDWLEVGVTFGVSGVLLMFGGVLFYFWRTFHLWFRSDGERSSSALGRMASVVIASLSDYPPRTPALMCFAALVCLWFIGALPERNTALDNAK